MSRKPMVGLLAAALVIAFVVTVTLAAGPTGAKGVFKAVLSGKSSVPPIKTAATGEATFTPSGDGTKLDYVVRVNNLADVTAVHLHLGMNNENGPPVVTLYPVRRGLTRSGRFTGELAKGVITAANLIGPLARKTVRDLVGNIKAGKTYVNVHTKAHPEGEIRGQIM
jgi:hypothetical protein